MASAPNLVVKSAVKEVIKKGGCNCSSDAIDAISVKVAELLKAAIARTKANKRKTVKPQDL